MDEILLRELHGLPRPRRETTATTWIIATRPGRSTFLHENPELKTAPYVWLPTWWDGSDAGWGEREAFLDGRLQRGDGRARRALSAAARPGDLRRQSRRLRGTSLGAGLPDDPRLDQGSTSTSPATSPASTRNVRAIASALRAELGYAPRRRGLHRHGRAARAWARDLCARVIAAFPQAKRPRARAADDRRRRAAHRPRSLPFRDGLEVRAYVHDLYRHLAACDLAVVQGGLTTLDGAHGEPPAVPLLPATHHFEQTLPRPPPARALRRRSSDGFDRLATGRDRRRHRPRGRAGRRLPPGQR